MHANALSRRWLVKPPEENGVLTRPGGIKCIWSDLHGSGREGGCSPPTAAAATCSSRLVASPAGLPATWDASDELVLFPHKNALPPPQSIFYPLFLNEDGRIPKNGLSKLHYRFRRYSTLTNTVLLESQYLQSYDYLLQILAKENQEDCYNFADIEIQAKLS